MSISKTWILIGNQEIAKVYEIKSNRRNQLKCVETIVNKADTEGLRGRGASARTVGGASNIRSLVNENSLNRRLLGGHINEVASYIEKARREGRFDRLILAAGPDFLGHVRQKLSRETQNKIEKSISKDFTRLKDHELNNQFASDVRPSFLSA